jgi:hypothetical protein
MGPRKFDEAYATRPIEHILRERVTILKGHIGLKIAGGTSLAESLRILDWTMAMHDHVGFLIGDVINFGHAKWGDKYKAALKQTGLALSTLKTYAKVSARIPIEQRKATLSYTHHREILRIGDDAKVASVLEEIAERADLGNAPTTREVVEKVKRIVPRKAKPPKKVTTSGKAKKRKAIPEPPPYEPMPDEQEKMDTAEEKATELVAAIGGLYNIVAKCDNQEKQRWLSFLQPVVDFRDMLSRVTRWG